MEKNYNYNYENRSQGQKLPIGYSNLGVSSCTSKVLDKSPVTNGSLWHTTDKNEFYYDWNGSRIKLNLTGDSSKILAELEKIKEDIKNLNPEAVQKIVNELKDKVNTAVSTVDTLKITVEGAAQDAKDAAEQVKNKVDISVVTSLSQSVTSLSNAIAGKADISTVESLIQSVTSLSDAVSIKADVSTVDSLAQSVTSLSDAVSSKADVSTVDSLAQSVTSLDNAVSGKVDISVVTSLTQSVTSLSDAIAGKADVSVVTSLSNAIAGKTDISTVELLTQSVTSLSNAVSSLKEGEFPVVDLKDPNDPTEAASEGLATVQDVMNYVNALIEKKKGELGPVKPGVPYLYTNGYKLGDTPIGLTDTLNGYEIVLNENNKFEIELLHKNEESGYYVEGDPDNSYLGVYFKVIIPSAYDIKLYMWDPNTNDYKATDTSTTDPAYALVPDVETPETTVYYYRSTVEGSFIESRNPVEDFVNAYGHLIKAVITKK